MIHGNNVDHAFEKLLLFVNVCHNPYMGVNIFLIHHPWPVFYLMQKRAQKCAFESSGESIVGFAERRGLWLHANLSGEFLELEDCWEWGRWGCNRNTWMTHTHTNTHTFSLPFHCWSCNSPWYGGSICIRSLHMLRDVLSVHRHRSMGGHGLPNIGDQPRLPKIVTPFCCKCVLPIIVGRKGNVMNCCLNVTFPGNYEESYTLITEVNSSTTPFYNHTHQLGLGLPN